MAYSVDSISTFFLPFAIGYFLRHFSPFWLFGWCRGFWAFCMGAFLLNLRRTGRPLMLSRSGGNVWCWTSNTDFRRLHWSEALWRKELRSAEIVDWLHTSTAASHWCFVEWRSITIRHINSATETNLWENSAISHASRCTLLPILNVFVDTAYSLFEVATV